MTRKYKAVSTNSGMLSRIGSVSLGLVVSVVFAKAFTVTDADAAPAHDIKPVIQVNDNLRIESTPLSQAIFRGINSGKSGGSGHKAYAWDGMILAQADSQSSGNGSSVNNTASSIDGELVLARTNELMAVDNREVDEVATRLKEIIRARYLAENKNIESMYTIEQLRGQLVEFENLLQNTHAQNEALNADHAALEEKLNQVMDERDNAINNLGMVSDEMNSHIGSVQALQAETREAGELLNSKEQELSNLNNQLNLLTEERAAAEAKAQELAEQLAQYETEVNNLSSRLENVIVERDNALETSNTIENDLAARDSNLLQLNTQLDAVSENHRNAESRISELELSVNDKESEIASIQNELSEKNNLLDGEKDSSIDKIAEVDSLLKIRTDKIADLEYKLASLKTEKDQALHQVSELRDELANSQSTAGNILSEKNSLADRLNLFEEKSVDVNNALIAEQQSHVQSKATIAALQSEASRLQDEIEQLTEDRDALVSEKDQLRSTTAELYGSQQSMQEELTDRQEELQAALDSVADLNGNIESITTERDNAATKIEMLSAELEALTKDIGLTQSEHQAAIAKNNEEYTEEKSRLLGVVNTRDSEITALNQKISALTAEIQSQKESTQLKIAEKDNGISQLRETIAKIQSERDDLESLHKSGEVDLANMASEVSGLIATRDLSKKEMAQLQSLNDDLDQQLSAIKLDLDSANTESEKKIAGLNNDLNLLRSAHVSLEQELNNSHKRLNELLAAQQIAEEEQNQVVERSEVLKDSIASELISADLGDVSVQNTRPDNSIPIRLGNADFFAPGSAKLTAEGGEKLTRLAKIIQSLSTQRIVVEGHTDSVPIGIGLKHKFESNWELSVSRAAAAVRHLQSKTEIDPRSLTAAGFGEHQPIAENDTEAGRRQNRRVEVVLYPIESEYRTLSAAEE